MNTITSIIWGPLAAYSTVQYRKQRKRLVHIKGCSNNVGGADYQHNLGAMNIISGEPNPKYNNCEYHYVGAMNIINEGLYGTVQQSQYRRRIRQKEAVISLGHHKATTQT